MARKPTGTTIKAYEKFEVHFNVATNAQYPLFQYDTTPPPGITPGNGITVEGVFTSPSGKVYRQPAFYMTEVARSGSGNSLTFAETNTKYWAVRFSPQEVGQYSWSLAATDAAGSTTAPGGTFSSVAPTRDGFISVSKNDPRFFEFSNGKLYFPVGPAWDNEMDYSKYLGSGINFARPWMAGIGAYSSNFARWKSSGEVHGNEAQMMPLTYKEHVPGHELSYRLAYSSVEPDFFRIWFTSWGDNSLFTPLKGSTNYSVTMTYKTANIAGPRVGGSPYGLVLKANNAGWVGFGEDVETILRPLPSSLAGTITANTAGQTNEWTTITKTYTTPANATGDFNLYLDNVTAGEAYIDQLSIRQVLANGSLGPEIVRNTSADLHT